MQVVIVEPEKKPVVQNIDNTLTSVQQLVGGTIQAVYPFEEPVALICNDDGKRLNLPPNRALRDCNGAIYDIVAGTFFLCAASADSDRFESLTDEQAQTYMERFAMPEQFIKVNGVELTYTQTQLSDIILQVAADEKDYPDLLDWLLCHQN